MDFTEKLNAERAEFDRKQREARAQAEEAWQAEARAQASRWHPGDEMPETGTVAVLAYRAAQGGIVYDGEIYLFPGTFTYVLGEWSFSDQSLGINPRSRAYAEFWWCPVGDLLDQLRDQIGKTI